MDNGCAFADSTVATSADKPATPTISTDNSDPVDGESITLTCTSSTAGVTSYVWKQDGSTLSGQTSQTYTIAASAIGSDEGSYTCLAYVDTVASDPSAGHSVACK